MEIYEGAGKARCPQCAARAASEASFLEKPMTNKELDTLGAAMGAGLSREVTISDESKSPPKRTLGEMIRAMRRGWRWSARHDCYIRITTDAVLEPPGGAQIEVAKIGSLPREHSKLFHVCWWDEPAVLGSVVILEKIRLHEHKLQGYESFLVNENGETITEEKDGERQST